MLNRLDIDHGKRFRFIQLDIPYNFIKDGFVFRFLVFFEFFPNFYVIIFFFIEKLFYYFIKEENIDNAIKTIRILID